MDGGGDDINHEGEEVQGENPHVGAGGAGGAGAGGGGGGGGGGSGGGDNDDDDDRAAAVAALRAEFEDAKQIRVLRPREPARYPCTLCFVLAFMRHCRTSTRRFEANGMSHHYKSVHGRFVRENKGNLVDCSICQNRFSNAKERDDHFNICH